MSASDRVDARGLTAVFEAMPEAEFQAHVTAGLEQRGWVVWHVPDSRRMRPGMPDTWAYHPARPGVLLVLELKRERGGRVTDDQRQAVEHLQTVPGVDALVIRPSGWRVFLEQLDHE